MAVLLMDVIQRYIGLAADTKPTGVAVGSTFLEYDTDAVFVTYDGANWLQIDQLAQLVASSAVVGKVRLVDSGGTEITEATGHTVKATSAQLPTALAAGGGLKVEGVAGGVTLPVTPAATESHLGEVGGNAITITVTPTLTVAGLYAANDFVGTSATAMSFANAVRVSAGSGIIQSAVLVDYALQSLPLELWLVDTNITPPADNAAWTLTDAHAATLIGVIPFSTYYASALNSVSVASGLGISFKAVATTIWGVLVTRGAPTYTSLDLTVRLNILRD